MAQYPIKMLKDENGTPFVPLVAPEAVKDTQGTDWQTLLNRKLEKTNIIAGQNVTITTDGNDITINSAAGGASANVIDNLDQTTGGVGVLDAHQGHVLKEMIPDVVNNLTTVDTTKALSAYQGYLLNHKVVPTGGATGQVLKKKSATDNDLEWGDAADPNAISGDSSVKKIVALTYDEYEQLVADDEVEQDTEYHIIDAPDTISGLQHEIDELQVELQQASSDIETLQGQVNTLNTKKKVLRIKRDGAIDWTGVSTPQTMPYNVIDYNTSGGSLTHYDSNSIKIGSGVSQIRVSTQITTDYPQSDNVSHYQFIYLYKNNTQVYKSISPIFRWTDFGIYNVILDVSEGDVITTKISTNLTSSYQLAPNYNQFGAGITDYLQVEILK